MKKISLILLFLGILIFFIVVFFSNPQRIFEEVKNVNKLYLIIGLIFYCCSLLVRCSKWNILLRFVSSRKEMMFKFLPYYLFTNMLSNFTPAKSGDIFGPIIIKDIFKSHYGTGLSVIVLDRVVELLFLVFGVFWSGVYIFSSEFTLFDFIIFTLITFFLIVILFFISQKIFFKFTNLLNRLEHSLEKDFFKKIVKWIIRLPLVMMTILL